MKKLVINLVAYGPVVGYIIYSRVANVPNSGFNWVELVIVILLGVVGSMLVQYITINQFSSFWYINRFDKKKPFS